MSHPVPRQIMQQMNVEFLSFAFIPRSIEDRLVDFYETVSVSKAVACLQQDWERAFKAKALCSFDGKLTFCSSKRVADEGPAEMTLVRSIGDFSPKPWCLKFVTDLKRNFGPTLPRKKVIPEKLWDEIDELTHSKEYLQFEVPEDILDELWDLWDHDQSTSFIDIPLKIEEKLCRKAKCDLDVFRLLDY